MQAIQRRVSTCQQALSRWSWRKFGNGEEQIKEKTKQLLELQKQESPALSDSIKRL
jgi:hypothetical protein